MTIDSVKKALLAACIGGLAALQPAMAGAQQQAAIRVVPMPGETVKKLDLAKGVKSCSPLAITCGQTVNETLSSTDCELNDGSRVDYWLFQGTSGQDVTATMRSSSVNSYLALLDPSDRDVQENNNGAGGNDARITYRLDSSGEWAVAAGSFSSGETGPYTLTLTCSDTGGTTPAAPTNLQATAISSTQIDLTWRDNSNNETAFVVEQLVNGSFQSLGTVNPNVTGAHILNLQPQTTYTFRVRAVNGALSSPPSNQASATTPASGSGDYLTTPDFPNFRFRVRIYNSATPIAGHKETDCIPETLCVSGAIPGRSEVFIRIIGPRPNGYLWPTIVRFTPSRVEVDIQQISTGITKTYVLPAVPPDSDELSGLQDRTGFLP